MEHILLILPALIFSLPFVHTFTGWSPAYLFRSSENRRVTSLLKGALAMGPEGWEQCTIRTDTWRSKAGGLVVSYDDLISLSATFKVGDVAFELAYRRDKLRVKRTIRRWFRQQRIGKQSRVLHERLARAEAHLDKHAKELDRLDRRVVAERTMNRIW